MTRIYCKKIDDILLHDINTFQDNIKSHILEKNNPDKIKESLAGWSLLKEVIGEEKFNNAVFTFNEYGKPQAMDFYFNISHSSGVVAIGISDEALGIDIQYVNEKKDIKNLALKLFGVQCSCDEFYRLYTSYEAYIKYMGKSIFNYKDEEINLCSAIIEKIRIGSNQFYLACYCDDKNVEIIL